MEEVLAATAGQARKSGDSEHTQYFDRPPKYASLNKNLIRKKSVLRLAADFFQPNKAERAEFPTLKDEKRQRAKVPWNPFVSLRGFGDSRNRTAEFGTARCRSSSPQKTHESGIDEFGTQKTMRRKSLQDLLGTVGTKLSLARRLVYNEDAVLQGETAPEAMPEFQGISPLVLPEPAVSLPGAPNAVLGSPCLYSTSHEGPDSRENLETHRKSEEAPCARPKLRATPSLRILNIAAQQPNSVDGSDPPKLHRKSQELKDVSSSPSPERLSPAVLANFLRDVSPQLPSRVRFVDEKYPPQYRYGDDFEDVIAPENANFDPAFHGRVLGREERYNSIRGGSTSDRTELSNEVIEKMVALTAAKMSKNLHLSTTQSRWSVDSSETDIDDMSDYKRVEIEMDVQDIIDRGKEIMTVGPLPPYIYSSNVHELSALARIADSIMDKTVTIVASHEGLPSEVPSGIQKGAPSPPFDSQVAFQGGPISEEDWMLSASYVTRPMASKEPQPEFGSSKNATMTLDMMQEGEKVKAQTSSCTVNRGRKRVISLENGERFRPRRVNSRVVSGDPVHIVYPPSEFCATHTKTYLSKSSAFGDLYQNHNGFSDYCLFDRSTRTYYPQALSDPVPELLQRNDEKLEVLWLPLELFPAASLTGQTDREDGCLSPSNGRISEVDGSPSYKVVGVPNLASDSLPAPNVKSLETEASNEGKSTASSSSRPDSPHSEHGAWVGYTDSAPHVDMVGMCHSNYTMAVVSTREVPSSTTGSLISEDPQPDVDDANGSFDIAVDSATARLYLGSLFSSTESLRSIAEAEVTRPKSADSILHRLKDAQPDAAEHVKTWIEMEREFLDKFAPGGQMLPDRRRMVAVYEAFKKLKGLADSADDGDALYSNDSDLGVQEGPYTEQEKWLRYREAYMGFSFEHVEDISQCRPTSEEPILTADMSDVREGLDRSPCGDPTTTVGAKEKGIEGVELSHRAHVPVAKTAALRDCIGDTSVEQPAYLELSTAEGMSKSHSLGGDRTDICWESNVVSLGSHSKLGSEGDSDTDSTAITMLSGYMFTHYAEQLRELPAGAYDEEQYRCEEECDNRSILSKFSDCATDIAPNLSMVGNASNPSRTEIPAKIDPRAGIDTDQLRVRPKNKDIGLATAMTVQVCPPPTRVGFARLFPGRSTSLNADRSTPAEAFNGWSPSRPGLTIRKRVWTPNKCIPSPITDFATQENQAFRCTSPSPSDADTEASENFGQKLKRYKQIDEEDKENDLWWTESISYG